MSEPAETEDAPEDVTTLSGLLDVVEGVAEEHDPVSVEEILRVVGRRSFGPLLLLAGLLILAPLVGDIPGVPTLIGAFVLLIAVQMLIGRTFFWLPGWLLARTVSADRLGRTVRWARRPAGWVDGLLKPRLTFLVSGPGTYIITAVCALLALAMPILEFIPFSGTVAGAVLTILGLALVTRDGLLIAVILGAAALAAGLVAFGVGRAG